MSAFELFSPTDYRYSVEELRPILSEAAFIRYQARVESALVKILAENGFCSEEVAEEVQRASKSLKIEDVYREEERIKHGIRALVNVIREKVSDEAKPFVHATATSYDIVDTANTLRYKEAVKNVIIRDMIAFELILMDLAEGEKNTIQIGRTHGQHAEPITFGLALAQYVSRWGSRILKVCEASENLVGKFSGAVGAYNALSLFFENPDDLEADLMRLLGLKQAEISTQIVPPEPLTDFIHSVVSSFGVLANFARDMRNLQRSEIGEVEEPFGEEQTGSSTMPQKRNPINFENVESAWKKFMPQMVTVYLDQVSEHQRDLTNSLSQRYIPELLVIFDSSIRRMCRVTKKLRVNREKMLRNFEINKDKIMAEPLYLFLAKQGHPNAHERVRQLTVESYSRGVSLLEIALRDKDLQKYIGKLTSNQIDLLKDPAQYLGIAQFKTEKIVKLWKERLKNKSLI